MSIGFRQEQRQSQKLVMTPQMQQSIQLLQMSMLELEQVALQEVAENPFLELSDDAEGIEEEQRAEALGTPEAIGEDPNHLGMGEESDRLDPVAKADDADGEGSDWEPGPTATDNDDAVDSSDYELLSDLEALDSQPEPSTNHLEEVDVDWDTAWEGSENRVYTPADSDDEDRDFTTYTAKRESLHDRLLWQLRVSIHGEKNLKIGEYIIGSLDDDGFLRAPMIEVAQGCNASIEEVEGVLQVIQTFEPVGVAARSLSETLCIQLRQRGITDSLVYDLVRDHLEGLERKKFRELARLFDTDEERIRAAFALISTLDPRPGSAQNAAEVQPVTPDVIVQEVDGRYVVMLNEGRMGGLRVNEYYRNMLKEGALSSAPSDKDFATDKLRGALWLIRNIERRKNTIIRVAEAIVDFQQGFFQKGPSGLRPLTLREVAEVVGMHESTVARVTSSKYMDTPRGIFEMKYFFGPGLQTASGDDASSTAIKDALLQLIASENPKSPLSDQKISEVFAERGINIARRTVAKYRDQLHILSAKQRKAMNQAVKTKSDTANGAADRAIRNGLDQAAVDGAALSVNGLGPNSDAGNNGHRPAGLPPPPSARPTLSQIIANGQKRRTISRV